jgi:hypothetical protein
MPSIALLFLTFACGKQSQESTAAQTAADGILHTFVFDTVKFEVTTKDGVPLADVPFFYLVNQAPSSRMTPVETASAKVGKEQAPDSPIEGRQLGVSQKDGTFTLKDVKYSIRNPFVLHKVIDFFSTGVVVLCKGHSQGAPVTMDLWDFRDPNLVQHPCEVTIEQGDKRRDVVLVCKADQTYQEFMTTREQLMQRCPLD